MAGQSVAINAVGLEEPISGTIDLVEVVWCRGIGRRPNKIA